MQHPVPGIECDQEDYVCAAEGWDHKTGRLVPRTLDRRVARRVWRDVRGSRPQIGVTLLKAEMDGLSHKCGYEAAWDDVSNAAVVPNLVREARGEARDLEMDYFRTLGVYERVPRSQQVHTGGKIIGVKDFVVRARGWARSVCAPILAVMSGVGLNGMPLQPKEYLTEQDWLT